MVLALGVAFGRNYTTHKAQQGHTIKFRVTSYDRNGRVSEHTDLIRYKYSDGTWKSVQTFENGQTKDGGGKSTVTGRNWEEFSQGKKKDSLLGYSVIIQPTEKGEVWVSPDLDEILKLVYYFDAAKTAIESEMVAVEVDDQEPVPSK